MDNRATENVSLSSTLLPPPPPLPPQLLPPKSILCKPPMSRTLNYTYFREMCGIDDLSPGNIITYAVFVLFLIGMIALSCWACSKLGVLPTTNTPTPRRQNNNKHSNSNSNNNNKNNNFDNV